MLVRLTLFLLLLSAAGFSLAALPGYKSQSVVLHSQNGAAESRLNEDRQQGKLSLVQRWYAKRLQKRIARRYKQPGLFAEREYLTEGFRPLPFFGALFTFGLVAIIMLFTAKDQNALNWALAGLALLALIGSILALAGSA